MIEVKKLYKRYGAVEVLKSIDASFKQGTVTAILGPNGSGKTTLMKSILGLVVPQKGSIHIAGEPIRNNWEYRNSISYVPQIANFPANIKVNEMLRMIQDIRHGAKNHQQLIDAFKLKPFLDKKLGALSGGTRQKVNIVLAFMFETEIVILDEPMAGLDPVAILLFKELIARDKKKNKTVLITTHRMSLVEEIADKVIFLLDGDIYFHGSIDELKGRTNKENLETAIAEVLKDTYA